MDRMAEPVPIHRRWFRFRLKTLLILVAVVAAPLSWIAKERRQSALETQLSDELHKPGDGRLKLGGPYDDWNARGYSQGWSRDLARNILGPRVFEISVSNSDFADLRPLTRLNHLKFLGLYETAVQDLAPLAKLTDLEYLILECAWGVKDITPLARLTRLRGLRMEFVQDTDLSPLAKLTNLSSLDVDDTVVRDLSPLRGLTNLEVLSLDYTEVQDLAPLTGLKALKVLRVAHTQVENVLPLAGLTNLEVLDLKGTKVSDLTPLVGLTKLKQLWVYDCAVSKEQVEAIHKALPKCTIYHHAIPSAPSGIP